MICIIQTITSLDNDGKPRDFQSMMFKYSSWEDYKRDMREDGFTGRMIMGTLVGNIKPKNNKVSEVLIDDDVHFEATIKSNLVTVNVKAYKVEEEQMEFLKKR